MNTASRNYSACSQSEPGELVTIIWLLFGNLWICLTGHQIQSTELNSSAAETWQRDAGFGREVGVVSNGFEEKTVGGLDEAETSPGLCLRQHNLSSLIASSANISHSVDQSLPPTILFEKPRHCVFSAPLSHRCCTVLISTSLFSLPLLLHIHAESLYLSAVCLWEQVAMTTGMREESITLWRKCWMISLSIRLRKPDLALR